jgi:CHAT domain-containing protein
MLLGRFHQAKSFFERALEISTRLNLKLAMSQDLGNLGLCYLGLGEIDRALGSFDRAVALARGVGVPHDEAYWLKGKGSALIQLGRYGEGLELHRQALAVYESEEKPQDYAEALYEIGELYSLLGDLASSERHLEHALEIASRIGYARGVSDSHLLLGNVELRRGRIDEAVSRYLEALSTAAAIEHRVGKSRANLRLAAVRLEQNRSSEALRRAQAGLEAARTIPSLALQAEGYRISGDAERIMGHVDRALQHYNEGESLLGEATDPETLWRIYLGRSRALVQHNLPEEAVAELEKAASLIESIRGRLLEQRFRAGYLQDKHEIYEELVRLLLETGRLEEAFRASERLRTNTYFDNLYQRPYNGRSAEQRRREIELREKIRQLGRSLKDETGGNGGTQRNLAVGLLSQELFAAEQEYEDLLDDLRPLRVSAGGSVEVPEVADLQRRLKTEEVLLEWIVGEEQTIVFALTKESLKARPLPFGRRLLQPQIELIRDLVARTKGESWKRPASSLYQYLLAPLESAGWMSGRDRLILVLHSVLHQLPFSVLMNSAGDSGQPLIDDFDISYLPTASVLAAKDRAMTATRSLLAVAPESSQLAFTAPEAESVAALYEDSELMLAQAATERRFKDLANEFRILHLATHGYFSPLNPLLSGLELNGGDGEDGRLEVHEILDLDLGAELVTLSACSSALSSSYFSEIPVGSEWVGLSRAFLSAGSQAVLATLWPVDDRSTMEFMQNFYHRFATNPLAGSSSALVAAQRVFVSNGKSTAHPYYWAPFVLMHGARQ